MADPAGREVTREGLSALGGDIDDLFERRAASEDSARALPHHVEYLLLVQSFLRRLLELYVDWLDQGAGALAGD